VPVRHEGNAIVLVGQGSPMELGSPGLILDVELPTDGTLGRQLPSDFNGFLYVLEGEARLGSNQRLAARSQIAVAQGTPIVWPASSVQRIAAERQPVGAIHCRERVGVAGLQAAFRPREGRPRSRGHSRRPTRLPTALPAARHLRSPAVLSPPGRDDARCGDLPRPTVASVGLRACPRISQLIY
jgi:hypothetical protein